MSTPPPPAQVSVWDRIIEAREDARFSLPFVRNKYKLLDQVRWAARRVPPRHGADCCGCGTRTQGRHLRGLSANLTLYWNVMPIVGRMSTGHLTFAPAQLPSECVSRAAAPCAASPRAHARPATQIHAAE